MGALLESLVRRVLARPRTAAVLGLVAMLAATAAATRIRLDDDARALIADASPAIARQLRLLSEFGAVDNLLIQVDSNGHPEELERAARLVVELLEDSEQFSSVHDGASASDQGELVDLLMPRRFLLDARTPANVLAPQALDERLQRLRATLLGPQGALLKPMLIRDPLGAIPTALESLAHAPGLSGLDAKDGTFRSKDGSSILVIATPKGNPFGGHAASRSMAAVADAAANVREVAPHVVLRPIGAHRFTHEAESIVRHDVHLSAALTLLVVLVVFLLFFRRLRLVIVALPPLVFGASIAAAVAGLWPRPIHGIVLAFAAACLGLSIDYTIHLLAAVTRTEGSITERLPRVARELGRSLGLAMLSTILALGVLALSHVDALRQMAVLAAAAVLGAFIGNVLWLPLVLRRIALPEVETPLALKLTRAPLRLALAEPRLVRTGALALAVLAAFFTARTRVDGDLRNLDTHSQAAQADEAAFARAFGDPSGTILAVVHAPTLDAALERADGVTADLQAQGITQLLSPVALAPAPSVLETRRRRWCGDAQATVTQLIEAGRRAGFRPTAFASFAYDLEHTCTTDVATLAPARPVLDALGALIGRPLVQKAADGRTEVGIVFDASPEQLEAVTAMLGGSTDVTLVDRTSVNQRVVELIAGELPRLGGIAFVLVALLLLVSLRDPRRALVALAPCLLGLLVTLGLLAALDIPINLMNLSVLPLLAGLGIDYGVLMVDVPHPIRPEVLEERAFGVGAAAATTLAGFGTLAVARYYAIATIGQAVLIAIASAALLALLVPPALLARERAHHG